jgi:uncharacterized membrane protein SirB2
MDLKTIHIACAALTLAGFLLRGLWMLRESPRLQQRLVRVLPHVVDTGLFLTGAIMVITRHGGAVWQPWLLAKLGGILLYIVLGMLALRPGRPRMLRVAAFVLALPVFAWIVSVAHTRSIMLP